MEMNNLSGIGNASNAIQNLKVQNAVADYKANKVSKEAEKESEIVKSGDAYAKEEQTVSSETGIYSKESIQKSVEEIEEQRKAAMSNMVREMLGQQAKAKGMDYIGLRPEQIVASAEDIDVAMQLGASHPMGPLHLGDLIGLDICLAIMEVLYNETKDEKYAPQPLLKKMVADGKLGKKTGEGFFN